MQALKKFISGIVFGIGLLIFLLLFQILFGFQLVSDTIFTLEGILNMLGTMGLLSVIALR